MNWKPALAGMAPYKPGRSIEDVKNAYGLTEVVKLASNENPYGTSPAVKQLLDETKFDFEIYPDGYATNLRHALAEKLQVSEDSLIFGSGSDEIIVMIIRALLGNGANTIMATPTFPQYAHHAKIEGAEIREVPLVDGHHDLDGFLQKMDEKTSVIWLCTPNNPTGNLIDSEKLLAFVKQVPKHVLIVLDEAYYEYIVDESYVDTLRIVEQFSNVVVLRTFSKAYGLAAFRIGYGIGHPTVISNLEKVRGPFNVTTAGMKLAEKALQDQDFIEMCREENKVQMARFVTYAVENDLHLYDSEANFVLMQVPGTANDAANELLKKGYIVRSGDLLDTPGYIRVTIGTATQNDGFFKAFDQLIEGAGQ